MGGWVARPTVGGGITGGVTGVGGTGDEGTGAVSQFGHFQLCPIFPYWPRVLALWPEHLLCAYFSQVTHLILQPLFTPLLQYVHGHLTGPGFGCTSPARRRRRPR